MLNTGRKLASAKLECVTEVAPGVISGYCFHREASLGGNGWVRCENCGSGWHYGIEPQPQQIIQREDALFDQLEQSLEKT